MNYYLVVLKKYAVFNGRAKRAEYWYFFLFNIIISIILGFVSVIIDDTANILSLLYGLAILIPGIAVSVRRLHDTNHSGWWVLIGLAPCIGTIVLLIFMVLKSDPKKNQYD